MSSVWAHCHYSKDLGSALLLMFGIKRRQWQKLLLLSTFYHTTVAPQDRYRHIHNISPLCVTAPEWQTSQSRVPYMPTAAHTPQPPAKHKHNAHRQRPLVAISLCEHTRFGMVRSGLMICCRPVWRRSTSPCGPRGPYKQGPFKTRSQGHTPPTPLTAPSSRPPYRRKASNLSRHIMHTTKSAAAGVHPFGQVWGMHRAWSTQGHQCRTTGHKSR